MTTQASGQLKSEATRISTAAPVKVGSSPNLLPWSLSLEYLITWQYLHANTATLTLNCESRWDMLRLTSWKPGKLLAVPTAHQEETTNPFQARPRRRPRVAASPWVVRGKETGHTTLIQYFQLLTTKMVIFIFFHISNFCNWQHIDIAQSQTRRKMVNRKGGGPHFWWWRKGTIRSIQQTQHRGVIFYLQTPPKAIPLHVCNCRIQDPRAKAKHKFLSGRVDYQTTSPRNLIHPSSIACY